jgi:hypothetical protein
MSIFFYDKKFFLFAIICGGLVYTGCAHKLAPDGHYQTTPVVADGNAGDWDLPLRFSDEKYTWQYNITNDNRNIYICILSREDLTQLRILRAGMSIFFDPKGEKNKAISISFPIKKQPDPENYRSRNGNPIPGGDNKSKKEQLLLQSDYYNTTGFLNIENGQYNLLDQKNSIQVAMKLNNDDSLLVYEAIVPIKNIVGSDLGPGKEIKNFSVGIVLNGVAARGGSGGNGSRPSFGGMRGGGMRGGGMGGGRGYGSGTSPAVKEEAAWYTFRPLSKPQVTH